jgi:hypothetical protein
MEGPAVGTADPRHATWYAFARAGITGRDLIPCGRSMYSAYTRVILAGMVKPGFMECKGGAG